MPGHQVDFERADHSRMRDIPAMCSLQASQEQEDREDEDDIENLLACNSPLKE